MNCFHGIRIDSQCNECGNEIMARDLSEARAECQRLADALLASQKQVAELESKNRKLGSAFLVLFRLANEVKKHFGWLSIGQMARTAIESEIIRAVIDAKPGKLEEERKEIPCTIEMDVKRRTATRS